jgi:hypothetical protein
MTRKKIPINIAVIQWQKTALFWVTTQRVVVISNCGTTFRLHTQSSRFFYFYSWTLKMGSIGCPEMSVINYHCSLRNNSEERGSQLLRSRLLELFKRHLQLFCIVEILQYSNPLCRNVGIYGVWHPATSQNSASSPANLSDHNTSCIALHQSDDLRTLD